MRKIILTLFVLLSPMLMAQDIVAVYNGMSLKDTINAYPAGTTFYVHPGNYGGGFAINKKVNIIGMGYFLDGSFGSTYIGSAITLNSGASGSLISGLEINGDIFVYGDDMIIEKNKVKWMIVGKSGESNYRQNIIIRNNFVTEYMNIYGHNVNVYNNIIKRIYYLYGTGIYITNNTFDIGLTGQDYGFFTSTAEDWYVDNNILGGGKNTTLGKYVSGLASFSYNVYGDRYSSGAFNGADATNILVNRNSIFLGYPTNPGGLKPDARAMLAPNSPARGAGRDDTDAGAFGGENPFILGGVPNLPQIYHLKVQSPVSQGGTMLIELKAKTNN